MDYQQGSTSYIYLDNDIIEKKIKSSKKKKSLNASEQYNLQKLSHDITKDYKILFVPPVYELRNNSYTMAKINDNKFLDNQYLDNIKELAEYISEMKKHDYIPFDYECYLQKDGRIALIDFGGFIKIK